MLGKNKRDSKTQQSNTVATMSSYYYFKMIFWKMLMLSVPHYLSHPAQRAGQTINRSKMIICFKLKINLGMGKAKFGRRIAVQSARVMMSRVENLMKGGAIPKPVWYDAAKAVSA